MANVMRTNRGTLVYLAVPLAIAAVITLLLLLQNEANRYEQAAAQTSQTHIWPTAGVDPTEGSYPELAPTDYSYNDAVQSLARAGAAWRRLAQENDIDGMRLMAQGYAWCKLQPGIYSATGSYHFHVKGENRTYGTQLIYPRTGPEAGSDLNGFSLEWQMIGGTWTPRPCLGA